MAEATVPTVATLKTLENKEEVGGRFGFWRGEGLLENPLNGIIGLRFGRVGDLWGSFNPGVWRISVRNILGGGLR